MAKQNDRFVVFKQTNYGFHSLILSLKRRNKSLLCIILVFPILSFFSIIWMEKILSTAHVRESNNIPIPIFKGGGSHPKNGGMNQTSIVTTKRLTTKKNSLRGGMGAGAGAGNSWCIDMKNAREKLWPFLHISYPCEALSPGATSAVVCMLTDGVTEDRATRVIFTATNYIDGAMALGTSLRPNIDLSMTHMLLLVREGFELQIEDRVRLESVGWTIGTAPNFPLLGQYVPRFPRYHTTYTKITALGMEEYRCVMLMDADTLVTGSIRDILQCDTVFTQPQHRIGGTLDLFRGRWYNFNTGSILWKTSSYEMERVYNLTKDETFMRRYSSDQEFLNHVYPDRINNKTLNALIARGNHTTDPALYEMAYSGQVVPLSWGYNAQTHVEVERTKYWMDHRSEVKVLHFTEKKGWQCPERHSPPPPMNEMPDPCKKEIPLCFCREANLYWDALQQAHAVANETLRSKGLLL